MRPDTEPRRICYVPKCEAVRDWLWYFELTPGRGWCDALFLMVPPAVYPRTFSARDKKDP
jgi:hypothetical protein